MEEKASLMIACGKLGQRSAEITEDIESTKEHIEAMQAICARRKKVYTDEEEENFNYAKEDKLRKIQEQVSLMRTRAEELINSFPELESKEYAGRYEIKALEEHLKEIYPAELIDSYAALSPIEFDDESEAFETYNKVEHQVAGLQQNNIIGSLFTGVTNMLCNLADNERIGKFVIPAALLGMSALLLFAPLVVMFIYVSIGVVAGIQGFRVKQILKGLNSVKMFLNDVYDEDIFNENKTDILETVDIFLASVKESYSEDVEQQTFEPDKEALSAIEHKCALETQQLQVRAQLAEQELERVKGELHQAIDKLEKIKAEEEIVAKQAHDLYLKKFTWEPKWMNELFLEVTPEFRILKMPYAQGNSIYYADADDELQTLSKLITVQGILHMHPDYVSQTVIDYKNMGGKLLQLTKMPSRLCDFCLTEEDIEAKFVSITNGIRARTTNILSTCASIDEFNSIMATYESPGEAYVILHIFGLRKMPDNLKIFLHNGNRVGYLFKLYLTTEEIKELSNDIPLADFTDFYEVKGNPIQRNQKAIEMLISKRT